jgi:hypothetical protein
MVRPSDPYVAGHNGWTIAEILKAISAVVVGIALLAGVGVIDGPV